MFEREVEAADVPSAAPRPSTCVDSRLDGGIDLGGLELPGLADLPQDGGQTTASLLISLLDSLDPAEQASDFDVLELVAAWERVASWVAAKQLAAVAEFARRPAVLGADPQVALASRAQVGRNIRDFCDDELAVRLTTSRMTAGGRLDLALGLAGQLRGTAAALSSGRIDLAKARAINDAIRGVDDATARAVEDSVLEAAPRQNPSRLRQSLKRALIAVDPHAAEARTKEARTERRVVITPVEHGMAELWALLPAEAALRIDAALSAAARSARTKSGETRTMDQLRADALVAPFAAALEDGVLAAGPVPMPLARRRGAKPQIQVTVPASVLLGISEAPGWLAGYGPITAATAREIAADGTWRRLITDPADGTVLLAESRTYRPPASMQRHIEGRDRTCRFPGCNWPASATDADHVTPFPRGWTTQTNLASLCRRHHRFKHADGLADHEMLRGPDSGASARRLVATSPGVFTWTMPTGHIYAEPLPPVTTPLADEVPTSKQKPMMPDRKQDDAAVEAVRHLNPIERLKRLKLAG